jgi:hypothetical protein
MSASLQITDHNNGTNPDGTGTAATLPVIHLGFDVPCAGTNDSSIGAECAVETSSEAVLGAGATPATKRTLWELGRIDVTDGGPDGDGSTQGDNALFMDQGLFVP